MSISYWGVDHGMDISKSDKARKHIGASAAIGALPGYLGSAGNTAYGAATAKEGQRGRAASRQGLSTLGGSTVGGLVGAATIRKPVGINVGSSLGGAAGGYQGGVENVKRGRVKGIRAQKYPMSRSKKG